MSRIAADRLGQGVVIRPLLGSTAARASCAWTCVQPRPADPAGNCPSFLLIFWAIVMVVTEGAIKLHDGVSGGFVAVDGGRWVIGTRSGLPRPTGSAASPS